MDAELKSANSVKTGKNFSAKRLELGYSIDDVCKKVFVNKDYLIARLKAYKAGKIQHDQMTIIAGMLSEQDIENVAEWYSRVKIKIFDPNLVLSKPSN